MLILPFALSACGHKPFGGTGMLFEDAIEGGGITFQADAGRQYRLTSLSALDSGDLKLSSGDSVRVYLEGTPTDAEVTAEMRGRPLDVTHVIPTEMDRVFRLPPRRTSSRLLLDSSDLEIRADTLPDLLRDERVERMMRRHSAGLRVRGRVTPDTLYDRVSPLRLHVSEAVLWLDRFQGGLGQLMRDNDGDFVVRSSRDSTTIRVPLLPPSVDATAGTVRYTAARDSTGTWVLTYLAAAEALEESRIGFTIPDGDSTLFVDEHFERIDAALSGSDSDWLGVAWSLADTSAGRKWKDAQAFASAEPVLAEVTAVELEGGFYGLTTDDGTRLLPSNLPSSIRTDGQRVALRMQPDPNGLSTRMWGRPIHLLEIRPID